MEKRDTICEVCRTPIVKYKENKHNFCSTKCKEIWKEKNKNDKYGIYICAFCGKSFQKLKSLINRDNKENFKTYCSKQCVIDDLRKDKNKTKIILECLNCKKNYETYQIYYKRNSRSFCSKNCYNEYRKADLNYPTNKHRRIAFKNYKNECENCGWSNGINDCLDVHHIDENNKNNNFENLIILCPNCHSIMSRKWGILENRKIKILPEKIHSKKVII